MYYISVCCLYCRWVELIFMMESRRVLWDVEWVALTGSCSYDGGPTRELVNFKEKFSSVWILDVVICEGLVASLLCFHLIPLWCSNLAHVALILELRQKTFTNLFLSCLTADFYWVISVLTLPDYLEKYTWNPLKYWSRCNNEICGLKAHTVPTTSCLA